MAQIPVGILLHPEGTVGVPQVSYRLPGEVSTGEDTAEEDSAGGAKRARRPLWRRQEVSSEEDTAEEEEDSAGGGGAGAAPALRCREMMYTFTSSFLTFSAEKEILPGLKLPRLSKFNVR
eukprot:COSAG01_NODE_6141_length_3825_cov_12.238734_2_plen_120_part_00